MKKLLLALLIAFSVVALASCDINDVLSNIGIGNSVCQHRDADDNGKCDNCSEDYTDGVDKVVCQHRDNDDDYSCDNCGVIFSDGYKCQHRDANDNGKCDYCLASYTDGNDIPSAPECEHDFDIITIAPTCENRGYHEKECRLCGIVIREDIINALGHDLGEPTVDVAATCTEDGSGVAYCQRECGHSETVIIKAQGHAWDTDYSHDKTYHWKTCDNCEEINAKNKHAVDGTGYCTVCDKPISATVGVVYEKSADGTYAEVVDFIGTAQKIIIADTYDGVPVKTIRKEVFIKTSITEVIIPNSVTTIGDHAFACCYNLTSVVIGDSVETIGNDAFNSCISLTSVVIPDSVETIGYDAFHLCVSLTSIEIGDSVKSIGDYAFLHCHSLTSVVIGNGVTEIGDYAFSDCDSLTSIKYRGTVDEWNAITKDSDWNYGTYYYTITYNYDGE